MTPVRGDEFDKHDPDFREIDLRRFDKYLRSKAEYLGAFCGSTRLGARRRSIHFSTPAPLRCEDAAESRP